MNNMPDDQQHSPSRRRRRRRQYTSESTFYTALLSMALTASPVSSSTSDDTKPMSVIGHYGPHRFHDRNGLSRPENIDYTKLTRINYGPFKINGEGSVWGGDANADPQLLVSIIIRSTESELSNVVHSQTIFLHT